MPQWGSVPVRENSLNLSLHLCVPKTLNVPLAAVCLMHCRGYVTDLFVAQTVARLGASSSMDCLSEYAQLDGSFFLPTGNASGTATAAGVASFAACVDICSGTFGCQLASYDYQTQTCTTRVPVAPGPGEAEVILALKGVLARGSSVSSMQAAGGSAGVHAAVFRQDEEEGRDPEGVRTWRAGVESPQASWGEAVVHTSVVGDSTPANEDIMAKAVGSGKYTFYQVGVLAETCGVAARVHVASGLLLGQLLLVCVTCKAQSAAARWNRSLILSAFSRCRACVISVHCTLSPAQAGLTQALLLVCWGLVLHCRTETPFRLGSSSQLLVLRPSGVLWTA